MRIDMVVPTIIPVSFNVRVRAILNGILICIISLKCAAANSTNWIAILSGHVTIAHQLLHLLTNNFIWHGLAILA